MKKKIIVISSILVLIVFCTALLACTTGPVTIKFNSMGGSTVDPVTITNEDTLITLPTPTRTGYTFNGWYLERSHSTKVESTLSKDDFPKSSLTLYASWEKIRFEVTFMAGETVVKRETYDYGTVVKKENFPSLTSYPNYEWSVNEITIYDNRTVNATLIQDEDEEDKLYSVEFYAPSSDDIKVYTLYKRFTGKAGTVIEKVNNPVYLGSDDYYFDKWFLDEKCLTPIETVPTTIEKNANTLKIYAGFKEFNYKYSYFRYEKRENNEIVITGLSAIGNYQASIEIPSYIGGYKVVEISTIDFDSLNPSPVISNQFIKKLVLPKTLRKIGPYAFYGCSKLEKVIFNGENLTNIGSFAFMGCPNIETIDIPDNVTTIGQYCFAGFVLNDDKDETLFDINFAPNNEIEIETKLRAVNFSENSHLATIGLAAFYNNDNLTSITLSKTMNRFSVDSFRGSNISNILFFEGGNFKGENGIVYSSNMSILYYYPKQNSNVSFTLADSIVEVGAYAFENVTSLQQITFSSNLTRINNFAFSGCTGLQNVLLKSSRIISIGDNAFNGCTSITRVELPSTFTNLGMAAFKGCTSIESIDYLDTNIRTISDYAFYDCTNLTRISIPLEVETIGKYAFYNCNKARSLSMERNDKLTKIDNYAFNECSSLGTTKIPSNILYVGDYAFACTNKSQFEIDTASNFNNVKHLGNYAFSNTSIRLFTISSSIDSQEDLGEYLFSNCANLSRISITRTDNYNAIPEGMFYGCSKLTQINFPPSIQSIGDYAFYNCTNLGSATFTRENNLSSVKTIGKYAFFGCTNLESNAGDSEILPNTLIELGEYAFSGCSNISKIYIPNTLLVISKFAFSNCTSLENVEYKQGTILTSILDGAFNGCSSLITMTLPKTLALKDENNLFGIAQMPFKGCTRLSEFVFDGENENGLYVEDGVIYRTLKDTNGDNIAKEKQRAIYQFPMAKSTASYTILNSISEIDRYAFSTSTIRTLALEQNSKDQATNVENIMLTKIGDYAFSESLITDAEFNLRAKYIGKYAFFNCRLLTSITLEDEYFDKDTSGYGIINSDIVYLDNGLTIDEGAFKGLRFNSISIPSTVEYIGKEAFSNQFQLLTVNFASKQNKPLTISNGAFSNDLYLTEISIPENTKIIGEEAFINCSNIRTITFLGNNDGISIYNRAFSNLHLLDTINIPANVLSLGEYIFENDTRLKTINFGKDANRTVEQSIVLSEGLFKGLSSLKTITIPEYVSTIGMSAFRETRLESITILERDNELNNIDLTIGKYAFADLKTLERVHLPKRVSVVGEGAFSGSGLKEITIANEANIVIDTYAFMGSQLVNVEFGDNAVSSLNFSAFESVNTLKSVKIPSINYVASNVFLNCKNLTTVKLGGYETIGESAFANTQIERLYDVDGNEVKINASSIGSFAFSNTNLISFITDDLTYDIDIGFAAFFDCTQLTQLKITTTGIIKIGESALNNCTQLETVHLHADNVTFGGTVFKNNTLLGNDIIIEETGDANYYVENNAVIYTADRKKLILYPANLLGATYELNIDCEELAVYSFVDSAYLSNLIIKSETVVKKDYGSIVDMLSEFSVYVPEDLYLSYQNEWTGTNIKVYSVTENNFVFSLNSNNSYTVSGYLGNESNITIPNNIEVEGVKYPVQKIGDKAFMYNYDIISVVLGTEIKDVGSNAFSNCENLESVVFGKNIVNIKSYAFEGCCNLTNISFNENCFLEKIETCAFKDCIALVNVDLPNYLEIIEGAAFNNCYNLASISFGERLQEIRINAFYNCINLVNLTLPSTIKVIGNNAFYNCSKLIYIILQGTEVPTITETTFNGTVTGFKIFVDEETLVDYKADKIWRGYISQLIPTQNICSVEGYEKYVVTPNSEGYRLVSYIGGDEDISVTIKSNVSENIKITEIGEYAIGQFVENLVLEEGIKTIVQRAFVNADNLVSVQIPSSVTRIGAYAFANVTSLRTITIVNDESKISKLKTISEYAFYNCKYVNTITLPQSLEEIGSYAFASETEMNLSQVIFKHDYRVINNKGEVVNPNNAVIQNIGSYAFLNCKNIKTILIKTDLVRISEGAFKNCEQLEALILDSSNTVTKLEENSREIFKGSDRLLAIVPATKLSLYQTEWTSTVTKTEKIKLVRNTYIIATPENGYFACAIKSETLATAVVISYLGHPVIDDQGNNPASFIKAVEENRLEFKESVTIPETISISSNQAYEQEKQYSIERIGADDNNSSEIPNGQFIGNETRIVTIPRRIKEIWNDAFRNCSNLQKVIFAERSNSYSLRILNYAFAGCTSLITMKIPNSTIEIGDYAFANCTSITGLDKNGNINVGLDPEFMIEEGNTLTGPATLTLGEFVFSGCINLVNFTIPRQAGNIGSYNFSDNKSLKEIKFSEYARITTIGNYAFANSGLVKINVPYTVQKISNYAFTNCVGLKLVYLNRIIDEGSSDVTDIERNAFYGLESKPNIKILVPPTYYQTYNTKLANLNKVVVRNQIDDTKKFAYVQDVEGQNSVTLTAFIGEEEVLTIPRYIHVEGAAYLVNAVDKYLTFENVHSVLFDANCQITQIKDNAFKDNKYLKSIILPNGIISIGEESFRGCTKLEEVILPERLETIGTNAFEGCLNLKEIILTKNIISIGNSAFNGCTSLYRVTIEFSQASGSLGTNAFEKVAPNFYILVPQSYAGLFKTQWVAVTEKIVSQANVSGDYVLEQNETGWTLLQYSGRLGKINLITLTIAGQKITKVNSGAFIYFDNISSIYAPEDIIMPNEYMDKVYGD